jgi:energy-coupling factor transport system ATP-binding protein
LGIIEIKDLYYKYQNANIPALEGVDLSIKKGEFTLLTGPSGCGKTTLCRCLNGLIPHFYSGILKGEVIVNCESVLDSSVIKLATNVGLIFQNPDNQIFALTVEKDVAFGLENLGIPKIKMLEQIEWALQATEINHLRKRGTHELSGGQKQRLAIASILAMKPMILVLDEPTSFLDPVGAKRIFEVLDELNKEHKITIIISEHRVDIAAQYIDKVILLRNGKIINHGTPEGVFSKEETRLTGVGIPRLIELKKRLENNNFIFDKLPLSPEEFAQQLKNNISPQSSLHLKNKLSDMLELTKTNFNIPIIQAKDVSYFYPSKVKALENVSLTIHKGEFVAIMGENGAGKTTLVKHFNGLLRPQSGQIHLYGKNISNMSVASLAKKVGLVFQNPDDQLFSENVEAEIGFALNNFGFKKEIINNRVEWALNLLNIERYRKSSPFILSGGERKRVALASVLAWDPDVVVLDEPTIGQDYAQKERLRHFLLQLRTQGKTTIIVTHDVEFVAECDPRVILMAEGKIIADGPANIIMTNKEAMEKASIMPPMITDVFSRLNDYNIPTNILNVKEALDLLTTLKEAGN